ncbi:MAG: hypothetical protein JST40_10580 [Armatimonadetes bacterium]|nr:hypothetical protein [Armatimonadota bacterium]
MSSIRDKLRKAAGLFVEFDESESEAGISPTSASSEPPPVPKTVEQIVQNTPGPALNEVAAKPEEQKPVIRPDGTVDFAAIYSLAKLTTVAFGANEALSIISEFPAELPIEARRATMGITLKAMATTGQASKESVIADASRKLAALASYSDGFEKQVEEFVTKAQLEIMRLEAEVENWKKRIENAQTQSKIISDSCAGESDRLDDILEFFSLDIPPSKNAAPQ